MILTTINLSVMTPKEITASKRDLINRFVENPNWAKEMKIAGRLYTAFKGREFVLDRAIPREKVESLTYFWTLEGRRLLKETAGQI